MLSSSQQSEEAEMSYLNPTPADVAETLIDELEGHARANGACTAEKCTKAWKQTSQLMYEQLLVKYQDTLQELREAKREQQERLAELKDENVKLRAGN